MSMLRSLALIAMALAACRDRPAAAPPPPPSRWADAAPPPGTDRGFLVGEVVVIAEHAGWRRPLRLRATADGWDPLGSGDQHLFASGHRVGDALLCIATRGDADDDHVEQLALVRGEVVTLIGVRARTVRNPSAAGPRVVFESDATSFRDLYLYTEGSGQPPRRLTYDPAGNFEPALSPDGARVAFASSRDGQAELYVDAIDDDAPPRRLTDSGSDDWSPRWSPDGTRLVFLSDRDGSARAYVVAASGGDARRLSSDPGGATEDTPQWSPDGTRVAVIRTEAARPVLVVLDPASRAMRTLTPEGTRDLAAAWSPDGATLAVVRERERDRALVFVGAADGRELRRVATTGDHVRWLPPRR